MGTRSNIAYVEPKTGKVHAVYCHWDGYVRHNGKILVEHYNNLKSARALVALGDISFLDKRIAPRAGEEHSFENRAPDTTVFYGRDRGETGVNGNVYDNEIEYFGGPDKTFIEYLYLFKDGEWYVLNSYANKYSKVKDALLETEVAE